MPAGEQPRIVTAADFAELREVTPPSEGSSQVAVALVQAGRAAMADNMGGLYRWDPASTASETLDSTLGYTLTAIKPTSRTGPGRWVRFVQTVRQLPHGVLVNRLGMKTFYAEGVTDASGRCRLRLTSDDTDTGPPLFTKVLYNESRATAPTPLPTGAVSSYTVDLAADLRSTTHGYYRANTVRMTVGLLLSPVAAVEAGVTVQFRIDGL